MAPSSSVDTSTVTSETSSSVPAGDTEPTDTLQPDGITSTDPGAQATELENMLDADPDDVCTARRVFVLADRMTGPATPEQAEAQTNLRVRVLGLWASLAPDELSKPAAAITAAALALGTEARSSNYNPVSLRSGAPRALKGAAYLAAAKTIRAWMDGECGPEDF